MNFRSPFFYRTLLFLALFELLSLFGYLLPTFNAVGFFVITLLVLCVALWKLEYGLYCILAELFVGSKGFLFFWTIDATTISLRIALWLVVMGVWAARFLTVREERRFWIMLSRERLVRLVLLFFAVLAFATVNGIFRNSAAYVFFDMNGWLFFLLFFPFVSVFRDAVHFERIILILFAAVTALSVKALFILYVFSHDPLAAVFPSLYRWIRTSGVGEITAITPTFTRVFFQSQIYTLIAFFFLFTQWAKEKKFIIHYSLFIILFLASLLLSFSRSFWVAGATTFFLFLVWHFARARSFRDVFMHCARMVVVAGMAFLLVFVVMNFPYPRVSGESFASLLESRATETQEAGVSSRRALLSPLLSKIRTHWFFGGGFGATVTYQSSDPRIVQSSAKGNNFYTTYAFEWGYLDLLLKFGLLGFFVYCILLWMIGKRLLAIFNFQFSIFNVGLFFGFVALLVTNIFSPYLNHPLGIGYLLLLLSFLLCPVTKHHCPRKAGQIS